MIFAVGTTPFTRIGIWEQRRLTRLAADGSRLARTEQVVFHIVENSSATTTWSKQVKEQLSDNSGRRKSQFSQS
jgi:hypothetical protein